MMKRVQLARRVHRYLGLFLLVFFVRYGITAIPYAHNTFFNRIYKDKPQWVERFSRPYERAVPDDVPLQEVAAEILEDIDMKGAFGAYKPNKNQLNIHRFDFWTTTRLSYFMNENRLLVEDKTFRWDHFLQKFHWRGGFQQDSLLMDAWGVMVDIVCISMLTWIGTGLFMWWQNRKARLWGIIAISSGFLTFIILVIGS